MSEAVEPRVCIVGRETPTGTQACRHFPQYQIGTEKTGYVAVCPRHFHSVMTKIAVIGKQTPVTMFAPPQLKNAFPSERKNSVRPLKEAFPSEEKPPSKRLLTPWVRNGDVLSARGRNHSYSVFQVGTVWYLHVEGSTGERNYVFPGQRKAQTDAEKHERAFLTRS